jgi:5-methylcytosine-specific restriction endonuclease McrA
MDFYVTSHFSHRELRLDLKASHSGECKSIAVMLGNPRDVFPTPDLSAGPALEDSRGDPRAMFSTLPPCAGPARQDSPGNPVPPPARGRMTPLAPHKVAFQFTGDLETRELYEQYRALVSHEIPSGEMALVYKDALRIAVAERTKRRFAVTDRPGHSRASTNPRQVPAAVKRAVSERDERRCTFLSESGKRCDERCFLEYDHAEPIARGGKSTVENVRLLCRTHNQYAAECAFGAEFMERKRREARQSVRTGSRP